MSTSRELGLDGLLAALAGQLARRGAGDDHEVVALAELLRACPESLSQQALHAVALDRSTNLAAHRHAQARIRIGVIRAREGVHDEMPARMRAALAVHALELAAPGQPATLPARAVGHRLGGEPLAALGAAALEKRPAGAAGAHARAKAVGACALALLGLVGPLHVRATEGTRSRRDAFPAFCEGSPGGTGPQRFLPMYTRPAWGGGANFPARPFPSEQ